MNKAEPKTTYLADYKPPPFLIEAVDLEFEIQEDHTLVTSSLKVIKNPQSGKKNRAILPPWGRARVSRN